MLSLPIYISIPRLNLELQRQKEALIAELGGTKAVQDLIQHRDSQKRELEQLEFGIDICFLIDCTASMGAYIEATKQKVVDFMNYAPTIDTRATTRLALVGYRDYNDKVRFEVQDFVSSNQVKLLKDKVI